MAFWILTGAVTLTLAAILALVVLRNRNGAGEPAAAYDLRVYRQQLKDLDKDVARGVVSDADADRLRTEISRRILSADAQLQAAEAGEEQPNGPSRVMAVVLIAVIVLGTGGLYWQLGAPGYGDYGLRERIALAKTRAETRPSQSEFEARMPAPPAPEADASYLNLVEQLRSATADRPDDLQGQALLAQHEARLGNFKAAYEAKARYIALLDIAPDPRDLIDQAELQVMAAGGYVSPESEALLEQALSQVPEDGRARYYYGLMMGQNGRPDRGYRIWAETLKDGPAGAPWIRAIQAQIPEMAGLAGVAYQPIPPGGESAPLNGPSAEQVEAMQDLSPEERQEMIEGMVSGLATRLAEEGGSPAEWAQLITALGVLGRMEEARVIYLEAQQQFAGDDGALDILGAAFAPLEATR